MRSRWKSQRPPVSKALHVKLRMILLCAAAIWRCHRPDITKCMVEGDPAGRPYTPRNIYARGNDAKSLRWQGGRALACGNEADRHALIIPIDIKFAVAPPEDLAPIGGNIRIHVNTALRLR